MKTNYRRLKQFFIAVFGAFTISATADAQTYTIKNPYENVNWETYNQYKTGLHMHSTFSDGNATRKAMLEDMYAKGFNIVTMTDHNWTTPSWDVFGNGSNSAGINIVNANNTSVLPTAAQITDWANGVGRDGKAGMIGLPNTNEQSKVDHINTFFVDYDQGASLSGNDNNRIRQTLQAAQDGGGISHINHPGRETNGSAGGDVGANASSSASTIAKYTGLFMDFESCMGMEIINKLDNESRSERILWDNVLKETMPQEVFVFGFSNDDSHSINATGYAWNELLMPSLDADVARTAMETGNFYAVSRIDRREGIHADGAPSAGNTTTLSWLDEPTPSISNIEVEGSIISITGADYDVIEWIADGVKIATGASIDIAEHRHEIGSYVRAQLRSTTGIAFTQPFGVKIELPVKNEEISASAFGNSYYYYERTNAAFLDAAFDMSALDGWQEVTTAVGYGEANGELLNGTKPSKQFSLATTLIPASPRSTATYFKKTFTMPAGFDANTISAVAGTHRIDDALIIYINGIEIYRYNVGTVNAASEVAIGAPVSWNAYMGYNSDATSRDFSINNDYNNRATGFKSTSSGNPILRDAASLTNLKKAVKEGENVITFFVGNNSSGSSDLWFDVEMDIKYKTCTSEHAFGEWTNTATCTEAGVKYRVCEFCGAIESEEVPALGHDWEDSEVYSEATCESQGVKFVTCKRDPSHTDIIVTPATDHNWGEWETIVEATCELPGVRTRVCANDETHREIKEIPAIGHDWSEWETIVEATCELPNVRTRVCANDETHMEIEEIPAIGHDWNEWETIVEATCELPGIKTRVCANDETHIEIEEIPTISHDWNEWETIVEATCESIGVKTRVCANDETHREIEIIPALNENCGGTTSARVLAYSSLNAWVDNGLLYIGGLNTGEAIDIYNTAGSKVYSGIANANEIHIDLRIEGVYLVKVENNVLKVIFNK